MSLSGISTTNLFNFQNQSIQKDAKQFQQEFAQLGKDLQSGDLSAPQSDFATLQQQGEQALSVTGTQLTAGQRSSPLAQAYTQLSKDLQAGNLSAAQQDYTKVQGDLHYQVMHHLHRPSLGGAVPGQIDLTNGPSATGTAENSISVQA